MIPSAYIETVDKIYKIGKKIFSIYQKLKGRKPSRKKQEEIKHLEAEFDLAHNQLRSILSIVTQDLESDLKSEELNVRIFDIVQDIQNLYYLDTKRVIGPKKRGVTI